MNESLQLDETPTWGPAYRRLRPSPSPPESAGPKEKNYEENKQTNKIFIYTYILISLYIL